MADCEQPGVAFVLSGGASLGAIQVGMLRALYDHGITPDVIVGTSAGALNGAFIASRPQTVATADALGAIPPARSVAGPQAHGWRVWDVAEPIQRLIRDGSRMEDRRLVDTDIPLDELTPDRESASA